MNPQTENNPIITNNPINQSVEPLRPAKDTHGITIAAMAVFVLMSLTAVGFLYNQNQQLKSALFAYQQQQMVSPAPSATPDPTANWKTYTKDFSDPQNLYPLAEIKYPQNWKYTRESSEGTADQHILFTDVNGKDTIDLTFSSLNFLTEVYAVQPQEFGQLKKITVNGYVAYRFQNLYSNHFVDSYFFPQQNGGYVALSLSDTNYSNTFAQILSTFKFIGPAASPSGIPVACPQLAKQCPDGSYVGPTGPNCDFAPCPTP